MPTYPPVTSQPEIDAAFEARTAILSGIAQVLAVVDSVVAERDKARAERDNAWKASDDIMSSFAALLDCPLGQEHAALRELIAARREDIDGSYEGYEAVVPIEPTEPVDVDDLGSIRP